MGLGNLQVLHDRLVESGANDPLLSALVDKLPPAGTIWPAADRQAWLTMASNAFDVVYGRSDTGSIVQNLIARSQPRKPAKKARKAARPAPPKVHGPTGPEYFIDRQGFAKRRGGERVLPREVVGHLVDLRGENGDIGAITWSDDSVGIPRGLQLDITIG